MRHATRSILDGGDGGVQPERHDDAEVVGLVLRDVAVAHGIEHAHGGGILHRAHEDVRVTLIVHRDLADADRSDGAFLVPSESPCRGVCILGEFTVL